MCQVRLAVILNNLNHFTVSLTYGMSRAIALTYCTGLLRVLRSCAEIKEIEIEVRSHGTYTRLSQPDFETAMRETVQ